MEVLINDDLITKMEEAGEHTATVMGEEFIVHEGVFSPEYSQSSRMIAEWTSILPGERVLDVGTGCGVQAILAAKRGASEVIAVDISRQAVMNTIDNTVKHKVRDTVRAVYTPTVDMFDTGYPGNYDVIIANMPFVETQPENNDEIGRMTMLQRALYDPHGMGLNAFFGKVKSNLNDRGRVYFAFADVGNVDWLEKVCEGRKIKQRILHERDLGGHKWLIYLMRKQ